MYYKFAKSNMLVFYKFLDKCARVTESQFLDWKQRYFSLFNAVIIPNPEVPISLLVLFRGQAE